jgi:hypothetical protein
MCLPTLFLAVPSNTHADLMSSRHSLQWYALPSPPARDLLRYLLRSGLLIWGMLTSFQPAVAYRMMAGGRFKEAAEK